MDRYDAIVLGAGGVGSAAMYQLARRGARVLGIDRFHPPHDRGSTHGHTRVIRQAYFEHSDYVPLLIESYRLWHELEQLAGRQMFFKIGLIQVGPTDGQVVPGVMRAARAHRLAVEELSATAVERRWPGLRVPPGMAGVFEPAAGYLLVEECVRAHLEAARYAGAELLPDTEVLSWQVDGDVIRVHTSRGEFAAGRLIVAAGSWARNTLLPLPLGEGRGEGSPSNGTASHTCARPHFSIEAWHLTVRRKSLFWFKTNDAAYDAAAGFPVFLFELPGGVFYGFPHLDERGVKVAEHSGGRVVDDPLTVDRGVDAHESSRVVDFLSAHLPGVSSTVADHAVCLYTMSPDEHFIIDRHPLHANVVFAAGLSGHGFKFVPVLGRALAELALDGGTELPIGFLSLGRFEQQSRQDSSGT